MIKFKYDENGNLVAYKDGKMVGEIVTMGDEVKDAERDIHESQKRS